MTAVGMVGWAVAVLIFIAWWLKSRRDARDWRHLNEMLEQLASGQTPDNFVFRRGGRFADLTHPLDKLAQERQRLRNQIDHDTFNLKTILASMEEGVLVIDPQHIIRLANPSLIQLFDLKAEPLGRTVLSTLREARFQELLVTALASGETQTDEVAVNGRLSKSFSVHAVPIREPAAGVVMIVRDVTRLKRLEDVRKEFVANVSHELRTPLSIFQGYVENLIDDRQMAPEVQREIFGILERHSRRLNALIEDLLLLSRLESQKEKMSQHELDLGALVRAVARDGADRVAKKGLTLSVDLAPGLPSIRGDAMRLEQVLHNLLENAVKYSDSGNIVLRAVPVDDIVEVRVEDHGRGIPPADLPHIFERFYRADKARSREQGGTGLGLAIVKHIVQSHGGSVSATSTYGKGTTIILHLPRQNQDPAVPAEA